MFEVLDFAKNDSVVYAASTHGLFRKRIIEDSWKLVDSSFTSIYPAIEILNNYIFVSDYEGGLLKSSDNGKTWIKIDTIFDDHQFSSVAGNDSLLFVVAANEIFKSADYGLTWIKCYININFDGCYRIEVNDSIVACLYFNNHLIVSKDTGSTWFPINMDYLTSNILSIALDVKDIYLTGENGIYLYSSENDTIVDVSSNISLDYTHSAAVNDSTVFLATNYGIYKRNKFSDDWQSSNYGLNAIIIESFNVTQNILWAYSYNHGIFTSIDRGETWNKYDHSITDQWIYALITNGTDVLIGTENGIYLSEDEGNEWQYVNEFKANSFIVVEDKIFAGGWEGCLFSTDNGLTWKTDYYNFTYGIHTMASIGSTIFMASYTAGIYVINDGSLTIRNKGLNENSRSVIKLLTVDSTIYNITYGGAFVSTDMGLNWEKTDLDFFGGAINTITNYNTYYFLGSPTGIFKSSDKGINWDYIEDSEEIGNVTSILVNSEKLYAASEGKLWYVTLSDLISSVHQEHNLGNRFNLSQNYPNPFNPTTSINYSIPKRGIVTLKIFDVLGREMQTLVNEIKNSGNYKVEFDASNFSSGIYFYKLQIENSILIKKMILLK
ncbi:MAG: T9SS type A sorting domain-containing protein [Ignavibacteriae bacterium]|nr:T9SS type A sorting domain-containing protein [Ignavibacteriota bacterium]